MIFQGYIDDEAYPPLKLPGNGLTVHIMILRIEPELKHLVPFDRLAGSNTW